MLPGPVYIIACPNCHSQYKRNTLMSGNTFGARFWTDGKMEAPMLPEYPKITKCSKCLKYFWVEDAEEISEESFYKIDIHQNIAEVKDLDHEELWEAINSGLGNTNNAERYLRIKYWHKVNDLYRGGMRTFELDNKSVDNKSVDNLNFLFNILDESDENDRIMKAEIKRELSDFDSAKILLDFKFDDRFKRTVTQIWKLANDNNNRVAEIER